MALILETERLNLREITATDAEFIHNLMNDPSYLRFIGDKGVKTIADARNFIANIAVKSYTENGFGHYIVELRSTGEPMGTCGYVKRIELDDPDIGFAFMPEFRRHGYAFEASKAILDYGIDQLGFKTISAITTQDNDASAKLLGKLGLEFRRLIKMSGGDTLRLFEITI